MATAGIKAAAYCLNFAPELALHYGGTPAQERKSTPKPMRKRKPTRPTKPISAP